MTAMLRCLNCGHTIAMDAQVCPSCGKQNAGEESIEAGIYVPILTFLVILSSLLFLAPAIVLGWFQAVAMTDTVFSLWSWIGSAVFWSLVGVLGYAIKRKR